MANSPESPNIGPNIVSLAPTATSRKAKKPSVPKCTWHRIDATHLQFGPWHNRFFTLTKRPGYRREQDPWIIEFTMKDRPRVVRNLGTAIDQDAVEVAMALVSAAVSNDLETLEATKLRKTAEPSPAVAGSTTPAAPAAVAPLIDDLIGTYYRATHLNLGEGVADANVGALRNVVRRTLGIPLVPFSATYSEREAANKEIGQMRLDFFTKANARAYIRALGNAAAAVNEQEGQDKATRCRITWTSTLNQCNSLFSAAALLWYEDQKLFVPPTVREWLDACKAEKPSGKEVEAPYNPPPLSIIKRLLHEWVKIKDRNKFLIIGVELAFGVRRGEVEQLTWGMFEEEYGMPLLRGKIQVKKGTGYLSVQPIDPFWSVLVRRIQREGWMGKAKELILQFPHPTAMDEAFREIGPWMKKLEWDTEKTNHALRGYSGSLIALKRARSAGCREFYGGLDTAKDWLRHASIKTTEKHYTHYLKERKHVPQKKILVRWGQLRLVVAPKGAHRPFTANR